MVCVKMNKIQSFINYSSPTLIAGLERLGFRRSLIDDFKGEITVITDGVITTADKDFPKRNPEYVGFYPTQELDTVNHENK